MMVREYTQPLVQGQLGGIDTLLYDQEGGERSFWQLLREIRRESFDTAFVAYPRFRIALLLWLARIPLRAGTGYRWYSFLFNRRAHEHRKVGLRSEADYNLSLLSLFDVEISPARSVRVVPSKRDRMAARHALIEYGIEPYERLAVLHPGSGGSARDWPAERFSELAQSLVRRGMRVVVSGTEAEKGLVERIAPAAGSGILTAIGRFSLMEYAAFAECACVFIANSTGPLHLAAAVGAPVIGFYPAEAAMGPARWGPLAERKRLFVSHHATMDDIAVESVVQAVDALAAETVGERLSHITTE